MKWFWKSRKKRAPLEFEDAVCFNWVLDTNRELQEGLLQLAEQYPHLTEERYTQRLLELFQRAGLELSADVTGIPLPQMPWRHCLARFIWTVVLLMQKNSYIILF